MPPPFELFTIIALSAVDPDSPLDTTLMTALRDNDIHTDKRVGIATSPSVAFENHAHAGLSVDGSAPLAFPAPVQLVQVAEEEALTFTESNTTFQTRQTFRFFVETAGVKHFFVRYRTRVISATRTVHSALSIDGATEIAEVTHTGTTFTVVDADEDSASLAIGWHTLLIRTKTSGAGGNANHEMEGNWVHISSP